jgi:perosamine synthetase
VRQIPFSGPDITERELSAVTEVIKSGWLAHGKYSKRLEELFCEYTGAKHATTVSCCTAGLHLSCLAAGFGPGDEVIVPAQTHAATAHAVEYTGAKPVFADVDRTTGNITIDEIERNLSRRTRGLIPVHMAGYPCEMDRIGDICNDRGLVLIEDCAHAIGTIQGGRHVGNFGTTGCFSFYPTKQITTGEGGVVVSNDESAIGFVEKYKAFGIDTPPELRVKPGVYDVRGLGYNFRMTDFQAALGVGQMERYAENVKRRRENARWYTELLSGDDRFEVPEYSDDHSYFLFQVIVKEPLDRDHVVRHLKENGVGLSIHYATPVPLMTYYKDKYSYSAGDFPNAVRYGNQSISLPVHPKVSRDDIQYVVDTMKAAF